MAELNLGVSAQLALSQTSLPNPQSALAPREPRGLLSHPAYPLPPTLPATVNDPVSVVAEAGEVDALIAPK